MEAVTDPKVHTITVMCCTQLMKTELINNIVGYFVDMDPAPMIVMQPTVKLPFIVVVRSSAGFR